MRSIWALFAAELLLLCQVFRACECWSESLEWPVYKANVCDQHKEVHQRDVSWLLPDPPGLSDVVAPTPEPGPASILTTGHIRFKTKTFSCICRIKSLASWPPDPLGFVDL